MPRGGRRAGRQGQAYGNRSDLNTPPRAEYRGQQYGQRKAQVDAQKAVPVAPPPTASVPGVQAAAAPAPQGPAPGTLGDLLGPSVRPDEPITAGLPVGAGPGPGNLRLQASDPDVDLLREIYRAHPSESLRELLEFMEEGR